jgi:uncharacterized protein
MTIASEADITKLIHADAWMMCVLRAAEKLDLPDWWIGAGFLRNKVWDAIADKDSQQSRDIDLVYFNSADVAPETDWAHDDQMKHDYPFGEWEIRNQARMHYVNSFPPFTSTADGISHWVETATCIAVRLSGKELQFLFCYGTDDLYGLIARPTPYFVSGGLLQRFYTRVAEKHWHERWPNLKVLAR